MPTEDNENVVYERLRGRAVEQLRAARGDTEMLRRAIATYLREGYASVDVHFSPAALTDYFCVDTPSILDDAGYSESEADRAVALFDAINAELVKEISPPR
jgi:hypothetical protein